MNKELMHRIQTGHAERFGAQASAITFAPGRIEVLGNHTDYNQGFVLSAAIDLGVAVAISPSRRQRKCFLLALDVGEEVVLNLPVTNPLKKPVWANYVAGVIAGLNRFGFSISRGGFNMTIAGDIPMAAGLSSSAALEVASALGFCSVSGINPPTLEIAKLCQAAEHDFVGTKCGLLDQISSLFGKADSLIYCDFRSLEVETDAIGSDICFLVANTLVKHNLVDSEYNERRARCEQATAFFATKLKKPVSALRDVSRGDFDRFAGELNPVTAKRAAHIIGENQRVIEGRKLLLQGDIRGFGELMFLSHESSRVNFENSCPELDLIVAEARKTRNILGARLSGGGFGGSAVMLVRSRDALTTARKMESRYKTAFGKPCDVRIMKPSDGARAIVPSAL